MNTRKSLAGISLIIFILLGQAFFAMFSKAYTQPTYEGRIYATVGVELFERSDLHKLNEAAHYFGQTIIGWTKFPHFVENLKTTLDFSDSVGFSAHMQERQNMVFTLSSPTPFTQEQLFQTKDHLQAQLDAYNASSKTAFKLTNVDTELTDATRSYPSGALITLFLSALLWLGVWWVRCL